jgi:exosortase/archaeosortase
LPVWRVNFADEEETSLYVSMTEARVVARRSEKWRLFDFFWMLHIMDYEERHDFNNPLLITFSVSALLFAFSGIFLLFFRFYRRDFNFILGKKKRG